VGREAERRLLAQHFAEWLASRAGGAPMTDDRDGVWSVDVGGRQAVFLVEPAGSTELPDEWYARLDALASRLDPGTAGGVLVWLPPGAEVPRQEPAASDLAAALQRTIDGIAPGDLADAALPIEIAIQKREESGAYVSAAGGLSPHWARFTDRVQGYFQIDSKSLHRLPADEEYLDALVERIAAASAGLALREIATVEAEDFWRVQRLRAGHGIALVGQPPGDESESGAPLRRRLRVVVREAGERLTARRAELRLLALYAHYPSLEGAPAGAALRGQDPALFGGLDLVALLADGGVRPLVDITRRTLPAS
jgi:hypothetical protein